MSRAYVTSAALLAVGVLLGAIADERPERPIRMRAGYHLLEVDFHVHTRFSDGFLSPFDVVLHAQRRGLDGIAVTEHNMTFPAYLARWYSELIGGPIILIGEEVTTKQYHFHAVGIRDTIAADLPLERALDAVDAQGGLAIAAHPVKRFWPGLLPARHRFHATELMHPIALRPGRDGWRWEDMLQFYEEADPPLAAIGSSDYHFFSPLGITRTLVFADEPTAGGVLDAVRARRTVVEDPHGKLWGDPAMIAALEAEPYTWFEQDTNYSGTGTLDVVGRAAGWLGVLGLLLLGPGRRRRETASPEEEER